ncbi:hypothetical protein M0813_27442 [Anaeramoeba flamelloides]|uniref:Uncharacterized protein n=1 Tax=Anaeramoeba flamelloides TaxID=1746091 RepID=A0ABQ8XVT6_9EUKA|nr:hypothetical protein M0813_27442 [Anaeramoeba flamelloides]
MLTRPSLMNKHEKNTKKKFGRFRFKTKKTPKQKQNQNQSKKTKTDKIKSAFRKKLKGRSRKEKSAVTALFVLSTKNKQKQEEQEKKKTQLLQTLENGLSTEKKQQQKQQQQQQQQQQLKKDSEFDLNHLRSLYTQYNKPVVKSQRQELQRQQLDCEFLRNRLKQTETQATEDTTSTYDQFGEESYDDSLSEDLASSSNEEFSNHTENSQDYATNCNYYQVSDEEMESLGDEIEIQFGSMQNEQNTHQLIFPEKISFVSSSYGVPTSYPQEYLYENY